MIEFREIKSRKIYKLKIREEKISAKFPLDENMDKINWKKIRKIVDTSAKLYKIPRSLRIKEYKKNKLHYEEITPRKLTNNDVIIYFHGGGFVLGNAVYTRHYTKALSKKTGSIIYSIDYPLAPDNKITDIMDNVMAIYDVIVEKHENSNITLMGTSAGGCIALALTLRIIKEKKKSVHALIMHSPLLDLSDSFNPANEINDKVIFDTCKKGVSKVVLGTYKKKGYYVSPLLHVNDKLPKTLITVDNEETLFTDSYMYYNKCIENDVKCDLIIYKNGYHAFQTLANKTKETKELMNIMNDFIKD